MSVAVIIDRIRCALEAGDLRERPLQAGPGRPLTMGDLVRPYGEVFPGIPAEFEATDVFGRGPEFLRKPGRLVPSFRRDRRPLPPPRRTDAPIRAVSVGIFHSCAGVWEWYEMKDIPREGLLERPFTSEGLTAFLEPLWQAVSDNYPMGCCLEDLGWEGVMDLAGIPLILPHTTYEEECAGVVEAFLSGPDSVASMLTEMSDRAGFLDIPDEDRALIREPGLVKLVQRYAGFRGKKSWDLRKLEDFPKTFFGKVWKRFPEWGAEGLPIISADGRDAEIVIKGRDTVEFCLAYAQAYDEMMLAMPHPDDFEHNEQRLVDQFIHEICEVWRKTKKMPSVPLGATLRNVFKEERVHVHAA